MKDIPPYSVPPGPLIVAIVETYKVCIHFSAAVALTMPDVGVAVRGGFWRGGGIEHRVLLLGRSDGKNGSDLLSRDKGTIPERLLVDAHVV